MDENTTRMRWLHRIQGPVAGGQVRGSLWVRGQRLVAAGFVTVGTIALATQWGPGQQGQFDSAFYLDGARHLASGEGFVSASVPPDSREYAPVTRWGPGFSTLIAAVMRFTDVPPLPAAGVVLSAAYVASALMSLLLAYELVGRFAIGAGILLVALFASQLDCLLALDALLSDLPFAALALSSTYLAVRIARAPRIAWVSLSLLGCCLAAMVLVRYAAALYIPGLMIALGAALLLRRHLLRDVVASLAVPSILVFASIAAWIARNRRFGPESFGERVPAQSDFVSELDRALPGVFSWWFALRNLARDSGLEWWVHAGSLVAAAACLALLFAGLSRVREALLFTVLPSLGYVCLMVFAASRVRFDPIYQPRFWIPLWPLTFLAVLALMAPSRQLWSQIASGVLLALLLALLAVQISVVRRDLPVAQQPRGLLTERWRRAAAALPDSSECRLFVTDVRPLMLHRALGPTSEIPISLPSFEGAARHHPFLCVATFSRRLRVSTTAERRRVHQTEVVDTLRAQSRLRQIENRDGVTVLRWTPPLSP